MHMDRFSLQGFGLTTAHPLQAWHQSHCSFWIIQMSPVNQPDSSHYFQKHSYFFWKGRKLTFIGNLLYTNFNATDLPETMSLMFHVSSRQPVLFFSYFSLLVAISTDKLLIADKCYLRFRLWNNNLPSELW